MCSILGIFGVQPGDDLAQLRRQALELSHRQRHRGPDWSGVHADDRAILVHERLAIVDPAGGAQPIRSLRPTRARSTTNWCASSTRCTTTTACAPTSR